MINEKKLLYPFPQRRLNDPSFTILRTWWKRLDDDRGERAALRRAANLTGVMLSPAFHRLLNDLRRAGYAVAEGRYPKLAAIAGLVARVRSDDDEGMAKSMGTSASGGRKAVVSELRMRRLLACDDIEELHTQLRRALALLDNRANLADLAGTVWNWMPLDENDPRDARRQMAFDYYAAAPL